jgi:hypothetical protein
VGSVHGVIYLTQECGLGGFHLFLETRYFVAFINWKIIWWVLSFHQCLWVILEIFNNLQFFRIFKIKEPSVLPLFCVLDILFKFSNRHQITGNFHEIPVCQKKYFILKFSNLKKKKGELQYSPSPKKIIKKYFSKFLKII